MLPIKNRLTRKDDFQLVHKNGKFFSTKNLSLICLSNGQEQTRIGVVVSKKFFRKAVDRNKIRRILRENLRLNLAAIRPGMDIVIHCKLEKMADSKEIAAWLTELLKKSRLLN